MSDNVLPKLTVGDLHSQFQFPRDDHPGRKGFELHGKTHRGWFYPNPPGCAGIRVRRLNQRMHVPAAALV